MSSKTTRGFSFPRASKFILNDKSIEDFLYSISPTITITPINTQAISYKTFNSIIHALSDSLKSNKLKFTSSQVNTYLESINSSLNVGSNTTLPASINLFFKTIIHNSLDPIELVITSSPQIKIDLTKGWKTNQSIFNFLKEMLGNNPFSSLFGDVGKIVHGVFSSAVNYVQSGMQMTGRDIQIGPYWSFSNNPLSNNPEFSMETVLINDCEDHYKINKQIVENFTIDYLPTTEDKSRFKFKPPYLFNIEIGINFGFIKKMYFCKATFNVVETGKYFFVSDEKIPEFFKLTCHFSSLLPDIYNLTNFNYESNNSEISANIKKDTENNTRKPKTELQPGHNARMAHDPFYKEEVKKESKKEREEAERNIPTSPGHNARMLRDPRYKADYEQDVQREIENQKNRIKHP